MASVVLQVVSKPLPDADMGKFMSNTKNAVALWRSSSAEWVTSNLARELPI